MAETKTLSINGEPIVVGPAELCLAPENPPIAQKVFRKRH
jgi:hypothetical protein